MNKLTGFFTIFLISLSVFSQEAQRTLLRGKVIYNNVGVPNENVINATTETVTSTNDDGEFEINVREGDILAFSAINFQFKTVNVTNDILYKNRLVVEVKEKVTELDEVVISPENKEKYIELKEEEFKKVDYVTDYSTPVINTALSESERGMQYGLNFVNIFRAIFKSQKEKEIPFHERVKVSEVLRQIYDDEFFVLDLRIPQDKIEDFLYYCDDRIPTRSLLKKENEFELIDFLVKTSKSYLKQLDPGK
ncbi:carboxypeptidase-like regulatory domain-containing protein [Abyssalbus ytuae]|uniref:Carboxypeptidase-like regulatory domain-containing protein n=1 Tax=Abyssalbus ytuae TaxID=2926907 RepID=A0A9E7A043_9FLAO|nr:carboxypeptidase-like regulatory domain-containing protein [Abyssalbus ytuae]UOB18352.1 carboxypeptidase-like regulatory domain-containing protein [Abyssalbus ytuae]